MLFYFDRTLSGDCLLITPFKLARRFHRVDISLSGLFKIKNVRTITYVTKTSASVFHREKVPHVTDFHIRLALYAKVKAANF